VLVVGGLSIGFLGMWSHIMVYAGCGCHRSVVGGIGSAGFGYVADVGELDWCCFGGVVIRTEARASVPIGEAS
jgi:hypothetical protein